eukprot:349912-Chlamydomonas_euryale.AAC.10
MGTEPSGPMPTNVHTLRLVAPMTTERRASKPSISRRRTLNIRRLACGAFRQRARPHKQFTPSQFGTTRTLDMLRLACEAFPQWARAQN